MTCSVMTFIIIEVIIITFSIIILNIKTFGLTKLNKMTLSLMTFCIWKLSMALKRTIRANMINVVQIVLFSHYVKCRYADCRGAKLGAVSLARRA